MGKVAFVCPIYDSRNHFVCGINLLKSKIENNIHADFYFVFSDNEQKVKFEGLVIKEGIKSNFNFLTLPQNECDYKSQVTIKKFYGLKCLKDKYDYIAAIDSETLFIRHINYEVVFDNMWKNVEMLKANKSPNGYFIMRTCFKTLGIYDNCKLLKETGNYLYNVWFNDIPLYKCDVLDEFFDWLDTLNSNYKNEWNCFEYYIFMAFLIIKKGYHLSKYNIESLGGIMEYLYVFPIERQIFIVKTLNTHWTSSAESVDENIGIRFHLDRDVNDENYNSRSFYDDIKMFKLRRIRQIIKDMIGWGK